MTITDDKSYDTSCPNASLRRAAGLPYVGWKILAYQYYHDKPGLQASITREKLLTDVRDSFKAPDWGLCEQAGELLLAHMQTQFEVKVEVHGWDITVEYDDTGIEKETYLVALTSDCLAWKRGEHAHKQLMHEVIKKLPWEAKVGCQREDGQFKVVFSSNMQRGFEPFMVTPRRWQECPIPEKRKPRRRRMLKMKTPTSYLGTRIKIPRRAKELVRP
jgi:hypothetical protein